MFLFLILISLGGVLFILCKHRKVFKNFPPWLFGIPIAHRGYFNPAQQIPENSLKAFQKAVRLGYAIELDVHLTKDGHVVVHHDASLKRLTGVNRLIKTCSLKEIKELKILGTQETIPTLPEVFALVKGKVPLYIELKNPGQAGLLEQKVWENLQSYEGNVVILSFNPASLQWFAKHAPHLYRGQNYPLSVLGKGDMSKFLKNILKILWISKPHFFVYSHQEIPKSILKLLCFLRPLFAYDVSSLEEYKQARYFAKNIIFEKVSPYDPKKLTNKKQGIY